VLLLLPSIRTDLQAVVWLLLLVRSSTSSARLATVTRAFVRREVATALESSSSNHPSCMGSIEGCIRSEGYTVTTEGPTRESAEGYAPVEVAELIAKVSEEPEHVVANAMLVNVAVKSAKQAMKKPEGFAIALPLATR
jgi:hypothetical protein